ncbi:hypothetical protein K7X08_012242 [Anisodus acutangulus]|uniref:Rab3 GTPase-activating protein non-catalytic subunit n=1 Tax=Anisodus acutangulus TaxID=402998 RepID=A0A9Q1LD77_9SOLA|nr:hypothetical protein K7X08_012242 [Anisodus acutangulus]
MAGRNHTTELGCIACAGKEGWLVNNPNLLAALDTHSIALANRSLVLILHWSERSDPVNIVPELSPIDAEYISAIEWLVFDDIKVLALGTSRGYLLIYSLRGDLIHKQIVSPGKILRLRVRGTKRDITQDASAEEVCVVMSDVIARFDGSDFQNMLQRWFRERHSQFWDQRDSENSTDTFGRLPYQIWNVSKYGPCVDAAITGLMPLLCWSSSKHYYCAITVRDDAVISAYRLLVDRSRSIVGAILSKVVPATFSTITSISKMLWRSDPTPAKRPEPKPQPFARASLLTCFKDYPRKGVKLTLSPSGTLAAITDSLGRILLLDTQALVVVHLWKGYRDASCLFVEMLAKKDVETSRSAYHERVKSDYCLCLAIHAPRKGIVEIWQMRTGPRLLTIPCAKGSKILQPTYRFASSEVSLSSYVPLELFLLNGDSALFRSQLTTHLDFISKNDTPTTYFEVTKPIKLPKTKPCSYLVLKHDFAYTYGKPPVLANYTTPSNCSSQKISKIVLEWKATSKGRQFDRIFGVWLGGVEIFRSYTAEPRPGGIIWTVKKDITRYYSLLMTNQTLAVYIGNIIDSTYTGVYNVEIFVHFYPADKEPISGNSFKGFDSWADLIVPTSRNLSLNDGLWFEIENSTYGQSKEFKIPQNAYRAVLEIYVSFHENDEFWEVVVSLDDVVVGAIWPFTVIYTGGDQTYASISNVTLIFDEKRLKRSKYGSSASSVHNLQKAQGYMVLKDWSIDSGLAGTQQMYKYDDNLGCYFRNISSINYTVIYDKSDYPELAHYGNEEEEVKADGSHTEMEQEKQNEKRNNTVRESAKPWVKATFGKESKPTHNKENSDTNEIRQAQDNSQGKDKRDNIDKQNDNQADTQDSERTITDIQGDTNIKKMQA